MTTRELLRQAAERLADAGCGTPRLDAECLLAHVWSTNRAGLIARSTDAVPDDIASRFQTLLERRQQREPLAHITGEKEFWSRNFTVTPDVLIPRPETEHLIEEALKRLPDRAAPYRICDIGTGSGCIAITLACELPGSHITATDISAAALDIARINATHHDVAGRITFRHGGMFEALIPGDGPFDLIISNPPYVAESEMADLEAELAYEPRNALTDEADGLVYLSHILDDGQKWLKPQGWIIIETGSCGLPATPAGLLEEERVLDLAGYLRAGIYRHL